MECVEQNPWQQNSCAERLNKNIVISFYRHLNSIDESSKPKRRGRPVVVAKRGQRSGSRRGRRQSSRAPPVPKAWPATQGAHSTGRIFKTVCTQANVPTFYPPSQMMILIQIVTEGSHRISKNLLLLAPLKVKWQIFHFNWVVHNKDITT